MWLTGDTAADALLDSDPLALLLGMVLDQQIPMERAFAAPRLLADRLGGALDAEQISTMDPEALVEIFSMTPALHRFPRSMAGRVQAVCTAVVDVWGGDASAVWTSSTSGKELLANLKSLPGFGDQKAKIFTALLAKQRGVRPPGWETVAGPYGESGVFRSVADIDSAEALIKVRQAKQEAKLAAKAAAKA